MLKTLLHLVSLLITCRIYVRRSAGKKRNFMNGRETIDSRYCGVCVRRAGARLSLIRSPSGTAFHRDSSAVLRRSTRVPRFHEYSENENRIWKDLRLRTNKFIFPRHSLALFVSTKRIKEERSRSH